MKPQITGSEAGVAMGVFRDKELAKKYSAWARGYAEKNRHRASVGPGAVELEHEMTEFIQTLSDEEKTLLAKLAEEETAERHARGQEQLKETLAKRAGLKDEDPNRL